MGQVCMGPGIKVSSTPADIHYVGLYDSRGIRVGGGSIR